MLEEPRATSCNGRTAGPAEIVAIRLRPSFSIRVNREGDKRASTDERVDDVDALSTQGLAEFRLQNIRDASRRSTLRSRFPFLAL